MGPPAAKALERRFSGLEPVTSRQCGQAGHARNAAPGSFRIRPPERPDGRSEPPSAGPGGRATGYASRPAWRCLVLRGVDGVTRTIRIHRTLFADVAGSSPASGFEAPLMDGLRGFAMRDDAPGQKGSASARKDRKGAIRPTKRTARSSVSRMARTPSVQQIAARRRLRPVAKALGWMAGETYTRGTGVRAALLISRTSRYSCGYSHSLTGLARMADSATRSLQKYAMTQTPNAITTATSRPATPPAIAPITRIRLETTATRMAVRSTFPCT